ncbi:unnamed protein product [Nippostrongylus brasiliensis]|uniref:Uncharacterized protein n=1 Tax=Nippostrongylus brasiliensis TaxID=27835 RepID=A0A0N4Y6G2_NIPBR|nr:unnamed protein product [Nippostrongylus brasiliensis]
MRAIESGHCTKDFVAHDYHGMDYEIVTPRRTITVTIVVMTASMFTTISAGSATSGLVLRCAVTENLMMRSSDNQVDGKNE